MNLEGCVLWQLIICGCVIRMAECFNTLSSVVPNCHPMTNRRKLILDKNLPNKREREKRLQGKNEGVSFETRAKNNFSAIGMYIDF